MAKRNTNRAPKRSATSGISKKPKGSNKSKATKHNDKLMAEGLDAILVSEGLLPGKAQAEKVAAVEVEPVEKRRDAGTVDALLEQICGM